MSTTYDLVRNRAALFDLSAEGRFFAEGPDAVEAVNALITADLEAIPELKALNTLLLDEAGGIIAILWVLKAEEGVWLICDADRRTSVAAHLEAAGLVCEDRTDATACLAVIGPEAQAITMAVAGDDIIGIPYLGFEPNTQTGATLCRLGYCGEFEYRFILPREGADALRDRLMDAGAEQGIGVGDLAALPLMMIEMRSLSQADHIPEGVGPIEAGLHWMIDFQKSAFPGRDTVHERKEGPGRKAMILLIEGDAPTADAPVCIEGQEVGRIAYAAVSPTLNKAILLAYVDPALAWVGIVFDVGGQDAAAVSAPLFITKTVSANR